MAESLGIALADDAVAEACRVCHKKVWGSVVGIGGVNWSPCVAVWSKHGAGRLWNLRWAAGMGLSACRLEVGSYFQMG
jgi:hypothetical protein